MTKKGLRNLWKNKNYYPKKGYNIKIVNNLKGGEMKPKTVLFLITCLLLAGLFLVLWSIDASAALYDRGNGLVYDDVLDITRLQNANYAGGTMSWDDANNWAHNFVFGGYDDWRLPVCLSADCAESEMSHLYYSDGITSETPGMFNDVRPFMYWLGEESDADNAFRFNMKTGTFGASGKNLTRYGWAVRDGDSPPVVPEPISSVLFMVGALVIEGTFFFKKRKK